MKNVKDLVRKYVKFFCYKCTQIFLTKCIFLIDILSSINCNAKQLYL